MKGHNSMRFKTISRWIDADGQPMRIRSKIKKFLTGCSLIPPLLGGFVTAIIGVLCMTPMLLLDSMEPSSSLFIKTILGACDILIGLGVSLSFLLSFCLFNPR